MGYFQKKLGCFKTLCTDSKEIWAEKSVTTHKVIVLENALLVSCHRNRSVVTTGIAKNTMHALIENLNERFEKIERCPVLVRSTLLDPRFKENG